MKTSICFLCVLAVSWSEAQDLRTDSSPGGGSLLVAPGQLPEVEKASAGLQDAPMQVVIQDSATLDSKAVHPKAESSIPELDVISEPSVYQVIARKGSLPASGVQWSNLDRDLQKVSAAYRKSGQQEADCVHVSMSVKQRLKRDPDSLLVVVEQELRANGKCSCEIVKVAIAESDMEVATVLAIVRVAIEASPENMRLIGQCAIAACPEALSAVQDLLAKYEKSEVAGDSAKSAKSGKDGDTATQFSDEEVAAIANPLDFPGGPRGHQINFQQPPLLIITPQNTTMVDP